MIAAHHPGTHARRRRMSGSGSFRIEGDAASSMAGPRAHAAPRRRDLT
jgi:hypothetical protein